jgi:hypothetical protein
MNFVDQRANFFDLNPDIVAMMKHHFWISKPSNPWSSTRHDDRASFQCSSLRQEGYGLRNFVNHVPTARQKSALGICLALNKDIFDF